MPFGWRCGRRMLLADDRRTASAVRRGRRARRLDRFYDCLTSVGGLQEVGHGVLGLVVQKFAPGSAIAFCWGWTTLHFTLWTAREGAGIHHTDSDGRREVAVRTQLGPWRGWQRTRCGCDRLPLRSLL